MLGLITDRIKGAVAGADATPEDGGPSPLVGAIQDRVRTAVSGLLDPGAAEGDAAAGSPVLDLIRERVVGAAASITEDDVAAEAGAGTDAPTLLSRVQELVGQLTAQADGAADGSDADLRGALLNLIGGQVQGAVETLTDPDAEGGGQLIDLVRERVFGAADEAIEGTADTSSPVQALLQDQLGPVLEAAGIAPEVNEVDEVDEGDGIAPEDVVGDDVVPEDVVGDVLPGATRDRLADFLGDDEPGEAPPSPAVDAPELVAEAAVAPDVVAEAAVAPEVVAEAPATPGRDRIRDLLGDDDDDDKGGGPKPREDRIRDRIEDVTGDDSESGFDFGGDRKPIEDRIRDRVRDRLDDDEEDDFGSGVAAAAVDVPVGPVAESQPLVADPTVDLAAAGADLTSAAPATEVPEAIVEPEPEVVVDDPTFEDVQ